MYRVILTKNHKDYNDICNMAKCIYDYKFNNDLSCADIDAETMCVLKIKYVIQSRDGLYNDDIPTFAIVHP